MNPTLEAALAYAALGWRVHPLYGIRRTRGGSLQCGCSLDAGCSKPGKHPLFKGWRNLATTCERTIEGWFRTRSYANLGLATGVASGVVVLDVDPGDGGDRALVEAVIEHGPLGDTVRAITGSGGDHYFFRHPGVPVSNKVGLRPGVDIRGDGGNIVLPPSLHLSGYRYQWPAGASPFELPILELPEWLLLALKPHDPPEPASTGVEYPRARTIAPAFSAYDHLGVITRECAFVEHCAIDAAAVTYDEWFSLATVLKPFPAGAELFDALSRLDPKRYRPGEPHRVMLSVHGGPRHCVNLGWSCPIIGECSALGVLSPAGLPFKLMRNGARS
jgi:hypothetical protein